MALRLCDLNYLDFCGFGPDATEAVAHMAQQMLAFNQETGLRLGIDFPNWVPGQQFANAQHVRAFGTSADLQSFLRHPKTKQVLEWGGLSHSTALPVPAATRFATLVIDTVRLESSRESPEDYVLHAGAVQLRLQKRLVNPCPTLEFSLGGTCVVGGVPQF